MLTVKVKLRLPIGAFKYGQGSVRFFSPQNHLLLISEQRELNHVNVRFSRIYCEDEHSIILLILGDWIHLADFLFLEFYQRDYFCDFLLAFLHARLRFPSFCKYHFYRTLSEIKVSRLTFTALKGTIFLKKRHFVLSKKG